MFQVGFSAPSGRRRTLLAMDIEGFWHDNVSQPGRTALVICFVAFVVTFVVTRVITRMIRSGRGPFHDNSVGGLHVHHIVPGIFLLIAGGLIALGGLGSDWDNLGGLLFGIGLALVLDEFALVLHLEDVYWQNEGRLSVDAVFVIGAVLILLIVVGSPLGADGEGWRDWRRWQVVLVIALDLVMAAIAAAKGKLLTAMAGLFIPVLAYIGAIRIARPDSPWARRRYADRPHKLEVARHREQRIDARWRTRVARFQDFVAGTSRQT